MKKFIDDHIISIYIICVLIIILITNIVIRNQKINELQKQINELKFEQQYMEFVFDDNLKQ